MEKEIYLTSWESDYLWERDKKLKERQEAEEAQVDMDEDEWWPYD